MPLHPFVGGIWAQIHLPIQQASWFNNDQSFGYIPDHNIESIFLGSFPVPSVVNHNHTNGNLAFFYGVVGNGFWPILSVISGHNLLNENQIFNLLQNSRFGITDIIKEAEHAGQLAADNGLLIEQYNDLMNLLIVNHSVQNIYITSGGRGPVNHNANNVAGFIKRYLDEQNYTYTGFNALGYQRTINVYQEGQHIKQFNLIALLSPSNAGNIAAQGIYNANGVLQNIVNVIPPQFAFISIPANVKLLQWAYFLQNTDFIICEELQRFLNENNDDLNQIFG